MNMVTLTTDLGYRDPYLAIVKVKLITQLPDIKIIDLSADIKDNNISDAGLKLCNQKWRVNPEISLDSRKYILQGRDIIESHAKHLESIWIGYT